MNAKEAPPTPDVDEVAEEEHEVEALAAEVETSEDDQGIGARVTAVFTAAEKAGQHIVSLAREEAEDIRRQARAEAEAYLREQKLQADKDVEQIFADARRKAEAIEEEARVSSRQVEDDARVRKERLREEARLIEERIAWAKEGLIEVNDRLGQVFLDEPLALQSEADS
jgi:cell division septum initiation protein DivIVA